MDNNSPMPSHRRLVIADDSAPMRSLVRAAIGADFREVVEAADGRELFWTLLRSNVADEDQVVITDWRMPVYDGLDILEAWRTIHPTTPIILMTAFPDEAVRRRAAQFDAILLAKPFSKEALRSVVREVSRGEHCG